MLLICPVVTNVIKDINVINIINMPSCYKSMLSMLSICPVADKRFPEKCWLTSWRSSTANETIICAFPIIVLPIKVQGGVIVMSLVLLISCGIFLWQPTVIGYFYKNTLSLLCSGRTRWSWKQTNTFWGLWWREVSHGSTFSSISHNALN